MSNFGGLPAELAREIARQGRKLAALESLPPELARHRVLDTQETCQFVNLSEAEWRKMRAAGEAPPAIKLGSRKLGWRIGDLIDWVASREATAA